MKPQLKRLENWPALLAEYLEENASTPFIWGKNDCCLFAANWILKCTLTDPAKNFRDSYSSALDAGRILRKNKGVRGLADSALYRIPIAFAKRGDIVAYRPINQSPAWLRTSLGILTDRYACFPGPAGLVFLDRNQCLKIAWRTGTA